MNWFKVKKENASETDKYSWIETERLRAIRETIEKFDERQEKFLWRTQSNFEKELVCCRLIAQMGLPNVLVIVEKEKILTSWWKKFANSTQAKGNFVFVSENSGLLKYSTVFSREKYRDYIVKAEDDEEKGMLAVDSVKGIVESVYFGGVKDKLKWMANTEFDLLIVDMGQDRFHQNSIYQILHKIQRKHTLYLWDTDLKYIQQEGFTEEQIFSFPQVVEYSPNKVAGKTLSTSKEEIKQPKLTGEEFFLAQCSKEEKENIKEIERFAKQKIIKLRVEDKGRRYTFIDESQAEGEILYAWMWFIKKDGNLIFRYKLNQNEKDKEVYKDNQIIVNGMHLRTIKNIIELLTRR